jgi:6-phosphogluconate dehydrogenase
MLSAIAANGKESTLSKDPRANSGKDSGFEACISYCGPGGAGHFVKMVHNGIEYGDMQAIAETCAGMRQWFRQKAEAEGLTGEDADKQVTAKLREAVGSLSSGILSGFLLDITRDILDVEVLDTITSPVVAASSDSSASIIKPAAPPASEPQHATLGCSTSTSTSTCPSTDSASCRPCSMLLLDDVADRAAMKGTGTWTVLEAAKLGVPASIISAAVEARALSSADALRQPLALTGKDAGAGALTGALSGAFASVDEKTMLAMAENALVCSRVAAYAQGLSLIHTAAEKHQWGTDLRDVVLGWRNGCIIRARILPLLADAAASHPRNIVHAPAVKDLLTPRLAGLKQWTAMAILSDIPVPAAAAALSYLTMMQTKRLPTAWVQAQRDCFGAHTYVSVSSGKVTHTQWATAAEHGRTRRQGDDNGGLVGGKKIHIDRVKEKHSEI